MGRADLGWRDSQYYVLSLAEPILFQLRRKSLVDFGSRGCAVRPEKSYSMDFFKLLCVSTKWPRHCRAGQKKNEFPPPHLLPPRLGQQIVAIFTRAKKGPMSALGQKQTCASQKAMSALPPIATSIAFFGMSALGKSGHRAFYSINSASDNIDAGIVNPRALAVVRLMTKSKVVGCSMGSSLGFAPRKILSTYSAARRNRAGKLGP